MPMLYAKCQCGTESREITKIDTDGWITLKNGNKRFDPTAPKLIKGTPIIKCTQCGTLNLATDDPKAVRSFLKFNYLED